MTAEKLSAYVLTLDCAQTHDVMWERKDSVLYDHFPMQVPLLSIDQQQSSAQPTKRPHS